MQEGVGYIQLVNCIIIYLSFLTNAPSIELNSSKASAGKELSLSSWCIASLYIYHFTTVVDFSSNKYIEQNRSKSCAGRSWVYPVGESHHYISIFSQLWLTSIREVQWFYWTQVLLVPAEKS